MEAKRKSGRERRNRNDGSQQRKEGRPGVGVSSIIRLFTGETACECYSICLMESLRSFLVGASRRSASRRHSSTASFLPVAPFLLSPVPSARRAVSFHESSRALCPPSPLTFYHPSFARFILSRSPVIRVASPRRPRLPPRFRRRVYLAMNFRRFSVTCKPLPPNPLSTGDTATNIDSPLCDAFRALRTTDLYSYLFFLRFFSNSFGILFTETND